jgi:hypothetical protein
MAATAKRIAHDRRVLAKLSFIVGPGSINDRSVCAELDG